MKWESKAEDQMLPPLCFLRNPLSRMAILAPFLIFVSYLMEFRFFAILLTTSVLVVSTVLFRLPHQKLVMVDKLVEEEEVVLMYEKESSAQMAKGSENVTQTKEAQEGIGLALDYSTTSPDLPSESECQDQLSTTEEFEVDWQFGGCVDQSPDLLGGSISDEDSLIEISLPSGHYVGHQEEDPKFNFIQHEKPQEFIFSQCSLMEFLAEFNDMNEEENLIEIDISMGSIKYSRFEIEA
ncbi:Eukaryotic translation initiation factor 3 subunit C like [Quillaja saponaria]|uniref:Eukaryotic translation initiation factor 3 subunit C like n=1 Tax=Quillaja saponaria TaxID=32244 RepID=A0AAD7PRC8_QUISA|nr:Eukaryotic translation initiation factor 3 subunit C like [Quillaja saponaria]